MEEFYSTIQAAACQALRQFFNQEATPGADPLLELVAVLVATAADSPPADSSLTTDQWFRWNQLSMDREQEVLAVMLTIMEQEQLSPPNEITRLKSWAENLVLATLDRLATM